MDYRILAKSVNAIANTLPGFNNDLLIDLRKREIEGLSYFIYQCYQDYLKVVGLDISMDEPYVASPTERLQYELQHTGYGGSKTQIKIKLDECSLMVYTFYYDDKIFKKYLYLPYLYEDNFAMIGGMRTDYMLNMSEKLFSIRKGNGLTQKVIRIPLRFNSDEVILFKSAVSDREYVSTMVQALIHNKSAKKGKKALKPTIILYLLAKFGLPGLLAKLGYAPDTITYENKVSDTEVYEYVKIQNTSMKHNPALVRIPLDQTKDSSLMDIVAVIQYSLGSFRNIKYENLMMDDITEYMIYLGKVIRGRDTPKDIAHRDMVLHLRSTDNYLDNYYKNILADSGIMLDDIYDLLIYMWVNIGRILIKYKNNNMFNKKFDIIHSVIIDGYIKRLYGILYDKDVRDNRNYMHKYVADVLGVNTSANIIIKKGRSAQNVRENPSIYGDNWLLSIGCKAIKRLGSTNKYNNAMSAAVNQYHPSMLIVESAVGFSNSNPSLNFNVNCFAEINSSGCVVKTKFAKKVDDEMKRFLPN